jgi:M6 family metalloprotease-like protein
MAAKERAIRRPPHVLGRRRTIIAVSVLSLFGTLHLSRPLSAQQPAQLPAPGNSRVAPPAPILGLTDVRPVMPLEFSRAWLHKIEAVRQRRDQLLAEGLLDGMTPEQLAEKGGALSGRLRIPVIPVRYSDVRIPFDEAALKRRLFGTRRGDTLSLSDYWREVSGGLLEVEGHVAPWVTLRRPARHYLPGSAFGWSSFGRVTELRDDVLAAIDEHIDWSQFDNDGPDGIPNSGDDDGFVDFVAIVYAIPCPGDGRTGAIWPHRAAMSPLETSSIGANGEPIRIADYVILPAVDPATCGPMSIGVLAHETGHALGLPDLYDYDGSSQGIGAWGLMGTGSHSTEHSPAHLGAWEKEQLGWVTVSWIGQADSTMTLPPVQRSRTVYRLDSDGDEYLLMENRQRQGSDRFLAGSGLLIWHIDPERGELGAWNSDERRAAVRLIQADGRNDLERGLRADAGDPFPGATRRDWFRTPMRGGMQLTGIEAARDGVLRMHLVTSETHAAVVPDTDWLRMTTLAGGVAVQQSIDVRRTGGAEVSWRATSRARWLRLDRSVEGLTLTADPGSLPAGTYMDTIRIVDRQRAVLAEIVVNFYLATPGIGQIVATELPWSWGVAVRGGRILKASYGWDQLGLRPRPRILQLWEGKTHPATLTRIAADALYAPIIDPRDGTIFVLARAREGNFLYQVRPNGDAAIVASHIGEEPAYGAALLPDGTIAVAKWNGDIARITRDGGVHQWMSVGTNIYQIATDSRGNIYAATYAGDVLRIGVDGARRVLETGFGAGRLVAIALTPDDIVIAAERGGQGRVVRIRQDGSREVVYRSPGARFYGLAFDDGFIYALDLTQRHLLRIPMPSEATPVLAQHR